MITITDNARQILKRCIVDCDSITLPEQLTRDQYVEVNRIIEALGGKWNRSAKRHLFTIDPRKAVADALAGDAVTSRQQKLQAFYTPESLASDVILYAAIKDCDSILEPSCGAGALVKKALSMGCTTEQFTCFDIDPEAVAAVSSLGVKAIHHDFLEVPPATHFDRVIMNPPFTRDQDIDHVRHAHSFLADKGRLVAITSCGWTFGATRKRSEFRKFVDEHAVEVIDVPAGTFRESGTDVATKLLVLSA